MKKNVSEARGEDPGLDGVVVEEPVGEEPVGDVEPTEKYEPPLPPLQTGDNPTEGSDRPNDPFGPDDSDGGGNPDETGDPGSPTTVDDGTSSTSAETMVNETVGGGVGTAKNKTAKNKTAKNETKAVPETEPSMNQKGVWIVLAFVTIILLMTICCVVDMLCLISPGESSFKSESFFQRKSWTIQSSLE